MALYAFTTDVHVQPACCIANSAFPAACVARGFVRWEKEYDERLQNFNITHELERLGELIDFFGVPHNLPSSSHNLPCQELFASIE